MGLPGSGKTYFAKRLKKKLECAHYNADNIREDANDWDFTDEGRLRQAHRMRTLADFEKNITGQTVICDFVCPLEKMRQIFEPDILIFMDTIAEGRFEDTNKLFERPSPSLVDLRFDHKAADVNIDATLKWIQVMERDVWQKQ